MRKKETRRKHKRSQKLWRQRGCSTTRRMNGGTCGTCAMAMRSGGMKGGMRSGSGGMKGGTCGTCAMMKGGMAVPGPLVGAPWTPSVSGWPGVQGNPGQTNYLANNTYPTDVQVNRTMSAGTQNDITNSSLNNTISKGGGVKRGGGIIPQDLVNFGRTFAYGLHGAYNSISGIPQTSNPNPLPYKDQFPNSLSNRLNNYK